MRPNTLAEAVERIRAGAPQDTTLAEFVDTFDLAGSIEAQYQTIKDEPVLTQDDRLDVVAGLLPAHDLRRLAHAEHAHGHAGRDGVRRHVLRDDRRRPEPVTAVATDRPLYADHRQPRPGRL